jgi:hypothetical protein
MWRPTDEQSIVRSAEGGDLQESHSFDAKAELPPPGRRKNRDLATDVAAMTVDGGTLVYGVGEDNEGRPTVAGPIPLVGQRERVDQIVQTLISEPPRIEIEAIESADDPSRGYIVVSIPPSPRAPHQVDATRPREGCGRPDLRSPGERDARPRVGRLRRSTPDRRRRPA